MLWCIYLFYVSRITKLILCSLGDVVTPLDLIRDKIVGRPKKILPFGCLYVCQVAGSRLKKKFRGRKLVRHMYLCPKEPRGGGVFATPLKMREMELFPASRPVIEHDKLIFNREELEGLTNESRAIVDMILSGL